MTPPRKPTPAAGTPVPTDEDWGEDTGVKDQRERAALQSVPAQPRGLVAGGGYHHQPAQTPQSNSAKAAFREIRALNLKIDEHSKTDKEQLSAVNIRLEDHGKSLTEIKVNVASLDSSVKTMVEEMRHNRELEKVKLTSDGTERVEKQKTERERMSGSTKIWLAVIGLLGTLAGILGTMAAK